MHMTLNNQPCLLQYHTTTYDTRAMSLKILHLLHSQLSNMYNVKSHSPCLCNTEIDIRTM